MVLKKKKKKEFSIDSSDPFLELGRYRSARVLPVREHGMGLARQVESFASKENEKRDYSTHGLRRWQGYFFESASYAYRGGRMKSLQQVITGNCSDPVLSLFDIEDAEGTFIEVKSARADKEIKLINKQVARQAYFLANGSSSTNLARKQKRRRIFYDNYLHGIKGMEGHREYREHLWNLFPDLRQATRMLIVLPFSVILRAWDPRPDQLISSVSSGGNGHDPYTRLNTGQLNSLIQNPREGIAKLDLDPGQFIYRLRKSSEDLTFNMHPFDPVFPILLIEDKNYHDWFKGYVSQNLEWLTEYMSLRSIVEGETEEDVSLGPLFDGLNGEGDLSFNPEEFEKEPVLGDPREGDLPF